MGLFVIPSFSIPSATTMLPPPVVLADWGIFVIPLPFEINWILQKE